MKYAFVNGTVLDGSKDMTPKEGLVVLVDQDKITSVLPARTDFSGYEVVDLAGRYIMPGLVNLHVHLPASGMPKKRESDPVKLVGLLNKSSIVKKVVESMCAGFAKTELMSGVTTIRTVGGVLDFDSRLRDSIAKGDKVGPRILASDMAVSVPGGHMAGSLAHVAKSEGEAREYVNVIAKGKPDLIKLMITGGVLDAKAKGEPGELKMPPTYVKAACDEAHKLGLKVAAHVESPEGVKVALKNGVDTIEHGAKPDDEIIALFKKTGAAHVATISPTLPFALFDRAVSNVSDMAQYNGTLVFNGIVDCAKECLKNDIPVGLGIDTGCPYVTHYGMWRELNYFKKYCDVTNAFALYTATKRNAEIAGIGDVTGTIESGKCADLIVTGRNPLDDLTALRDVDMVMARGNLIINPKVKKSAVVEAELDKFI